MNRPAIISALTAAIAAFFAGRYFPAAAEPATKPSSVSVIASAAEKTSRPAGAADPKTVANPAPEVPATSPQGIAAAEELMKKLEQLVGSQERGGFDRIMGEWLAADPEGAVAFLATSERRDILLQKATTLWAKADPAACSAWLAAHTAFAGRDAMAAGLADAVVKEDPQAALKWVASIKDPAIKINAAEETGYQFYRQNDSAAAEAFTGMGLPASARDAVTTAWSRRLTAVSRRDAQNLTSVYTASRAAGATLDASSVEDIRALLAAGVKGSGQFAGATFQLNSKDLTEREVTTAGTYVEMSGDKLNYKNN